MRELMDRCVKQDELINVLRPTFKHPERAKEPNRLINLTKGNADYLLL